jgi:hypothetical protein
LTYNAVTGYDLVTGLGSPRPALITALAGIATTNPWTEIDAGSVTSVAATSTTGKVWLITGGQVHGYDNGTWSTTPSFPSGTPIQVAVGPSSDSNTLWVLSSNGRLYTLVGSDTWVLMNGSGTGNWKTLTSVGVGPPGPYSVWATSDTFFEGNCGYTVYYSAGTESSSPWTMVSDVGAIGAAVSPTDGTPWLVTCDHHKLLKGSVSGSTWTFVSVDPFPWNLDGGTLDAGQYTAGLFAQSVALGPANYDAGAYNDAGVNNGGVGAWTVQPDSGAILDLVLWNAHNGATWNFVPAPPATDGIPMQISVAPNNGEPWVVTSTGKVIYAASWPRQ